MIATCNGVIPGTPRLGHTRFVSLSVIQEIRQSFLDRAINSSIVGMPWAKRAMGFGYVSITTPEYHMGYIMALSRAP